MFKKIWKSICNLFNTKEIVTKPIYDGTIITYSDSDSRLITLQKAKSFTDVWVLMKGDKEIYEGWIAEKTPAQLYVVYSMPDMTLRELFVSISPSVSNDCTFITTKDYTLYFNKEDVIKI